MAPPGDLKLLRRFEPILRFTEGEYFLPAAVEDHVRCCELLGRRPGRQPTGVAPKGSLTIERLAELGHERPRPGQYLRFVNEPANHPYYDRVVRGRGYTVLQYWYFYAYNDWRSRVFGVNDHEGDWEQVSAFLAGAGR